LFFTVTIVGRILLDLSIFAFSHDNYNRGIGWYMTQTQQQKNSKTYTERELEEK
jgi:hypothetical protein